ncbi:hypothetical protein CC80DRAFT_500816 [Byssothecium circinans]|uniref:Uncharacterized protein n=1 Tax=Byssothecium circinans TaxID=147558 RepID=A0A6A5U5S9_9PLEO|nr:hypothetical protein CC80DRAFT_500816 [Byssothecium circinans]
MSLEGQVPHVRHREYQTVPVEAGIISWAVPIVHWAVSEASGCVSTVSFLNPEDQAKILQLLQSTRRCMLVPEGNALRDGVNGGSKHLHVFNRLLLARKEMRRDFLSFKELSLNNSNNRLRRRALLPYLKALNVSKDDLRRRRSGSPRGIIPLTWPWDDGHSRVDQAIYTSIYATKG